jgi:hypothetical protein
MRSGASRRVNAFSVVVGGATLFAIGLALAPVLTPDDAAMDREAVKAELRAHLEDIAGADILRFDVHDDRGFPMEPGAIVSAPDGGYAAVYWVVLDEVGTFATELATSLDLIDRTWRATLAESASQPTMESAADGGWVVGWEKEPPNHLQFAWYATWDDLMAARHSRFLDVPMTLAPPDCAEGTPSLYAASSTFLDVGFHYFDRCERDRPARGTTDWIDWAAAPRPIYEAAFRSHGLDGGVGDRDTFRYRGLDLTVQEGQAVWERYETFRVYLYDDAIGLAEPLDLRTPQGCVAFTNPMVELLDLDGEPAMVVTAFVPGEAGQDCEVGPMLYVQRLDR